MFWGKKSLNLTEGSIIKPLILLAIPIIIANTLQIAYQITDAFWVGRLGADAVASISLSFPILFLMISLASGFSSAGAILVSQYKGKKDQRSVDYISAQTIVIVVLVSIIIALLGFFSSEYIIGLTGAEPSVAAGAITYLKISFLGIVFIFGYFVVQSLMRGFGNTTTPMFLVLLSVFLNLFLDPVFILGFGPIPKFGVAGAAIATVATQSLAFILGVILLCRGKHGIHIKKKDLKPDLKTFSKLFSLGIPVSIEQAVRAFAITVLTFLVSIFGTVATAAYGLGAIVFSIVIMPAMGFSMATSVMVGQNMGAGKVKRAEKISKTSSLIMFVVLTIFGVVVFFLSDLIVSVFIPGDTSVVKVASTFIRLTSITFGFIGIQQVLNGTFRGTGNTKISMFFSILSLWLIRIPIAYILSLVVHMNEVGVWISFPVSNVLAALLVIAFFMKGTWKRKKLV